MIQSIAEYLGVAERRLEELGVFNGLLGRDTNLFLSPALLGTCGVPDLGDPYATVEEHLFKIMEDLSGSDGNDEKWKAALRTLRFEEVPEIGLGYSTRGTRGNRITLDQKELLLAGLHRLLKLSIASPENLAFAMPLQQGLGPDAMSDFLASVLKRNFLHYTQTICTRLDIPRDRLKGFRLSAGDPDRFLVPPHPYLAQHKGSVRAPRPLILIPQAILTPMPRFTTGSRLAYLFPSASDERGALRKLFSNAATRVARLKRREQSQNDLLQFLQDRPDIRGLVLGRFAEEMRIPVKYEDLTQTLFHVARNLVRPQNPLPNRISSEEELRAFMASLCDYVHRQFELRERAAGLFNSHKDLREDNVQFVLEVLFQREAERAGLTCLRASPGEKKQDFEFVAHSGLKAGIEIKVLKKKSGPILPAQLGRYWKMHGPLSQLILLVFHSGVSQSQLDQVKNLQCPFPLEKYTVDVSPKVSPSKDRNGYAQAKRLAMSHSAD